MRRFSLAPRLAGGLGVLTLAIAACGGGGGSNTSSASATANPNAAFGGTMTIGIVQEPTSFLAYNFTDSMTFSVWVDSVSNEGLLWFRSTDETANAKTQADFYRPDLATEVPTTTNGDVKTSGCANAAAKMCVTWKLRDNVFWQDGTKFSSADVCATFDAWWLKYQDKNPTAVLSTSGWDQSIKCTANGPLQATVDFKSQYGPYLSLGTGVYGIMPAKQLKVAFDTNADIEKTPVTMDLTKGSGNPDAYVGTDTLDKTTNGTGPFVLQKYEPTKDIIFVRNKKYWDKSHQPHLDKIIFKILADVPTQLNEAKVGTIDFGLDYRLAFLQDLLNTQNTTGKLKVETIPESGAEKMDLNTCDNAKGLCGAPAKKSPFLADSAVRHAMIAAINRDQLVQTLAAGQTKVPDDSFLYLGAEFIRDSKVPHTKYDPAAAKTLLDNAGYKLDPKCDGGQTRSKNGACLDLDIATTSGNPARERAEPVLASDLQAVGIHINTPYKNVKAGKLFGSFSAGGVLYTHQFDIAMYTNTLSAPAEPDSFFAGYTSSNIPSAANSGNGQNDTGEDNPLVDSGMDAGRSSVDLAKRAAAYRTAEEQLAKDLPEIPLYQQVTVNSYTSKLQGLKRNDIDVTYNAFDWYCSGGNCQA